MPAAVKMQSMTSVKIPKGHNIHVCSYASTTLTIAATDLTIEATVLPPVRVKLATVSKVDGSLRPGYARASDGQRQPAAVGRERARYIDTVDGVCTPRVRADVGCAIGAWSPHTDTRSRCPLYFSLTPAATSVRTSLVHSRTRKESQ